MATVHFHFTPSTISPTLMRTSMAALSAGIRVFNSSSYRRHCHVPTRLDTSMTPLDARSKWDIAVLSNLRRILIRYFAQCPLTRALSF